MTQRFRLAQGGRIDRNRPLQFRFDGRSYTGFAGDTLASALLANGVRVTGRSFKYHRPRGLLATGCDEPNTLVQLGTGAHTEPNLKATQVELYEGLVARAVNCAPNARWDWMALTQWFKPLMPAGFYYKTFIAPNWHWYENTIRRAAGLGRAPGAADPDGYDKHSATCDVLVVGAGPSGLAAALAASQSAARVLLVDDQSAPGGSARYDASPIEGAAPAAWLSRTLLDLDAFENCTRLRRTTAFGYYDHNQVMAVEQLGDHLGPAERRGPRQRLWKIRACEVILATGAIERPLVFPNNDRPGVMLAGAARQYLHRFGVIPGARVLVATNNDSACEVALELKAAGVQVAGLADLRAAPPAALVERLRAAGIELFAGHAPTDVTGAQGLRAVELHRVDAQGRAERDTCREIAVDALLVSGGWNPTVHLFSQAGGKLRFDTTLQTFVPQQAAANQRSVGAAAGNLTPDLAQAAESGWQSAEAAGCVSYRREARSGPPPQPATPLPGVWEIDVSGLGRSDGKSWVDFLSDVTAADLRLALRENFRSIEHLKRYTTTGMQPDQGKTSNVNAIGIAATALGKAPGELGTTKFRPPFNPVTFGAIAGRHRRAFYRPLRQLPGHASHLALGARLEDYGGWLRPAFYPRAGESEHAAVAREVLAVRTAAGLFESSPLGKILVQGPDAAELLHRIYVNNIKSLKVGRCRYGLMLGEDGVIMDDGICTRLAEDRFLVGTTSSNVGRVADWLEEWLQCEWVELDVRVEPVTTQWAVVTLTGPQARAVLQGLGLLIVFSPEAFPHMSVREAQLGAVPIRIMRVSFTGEVSYEISVPFSYGRSLWDTLLAQGQAHGVAPFGIETMMALRIEKGFLHVGTDTDGTTFPQDVGMAGIVAQKPDDFVGRRSTMTPEGRRADRRRLVGLRPLDDATLLPVGGHLVGADFAGPPYRTQGWVTSSVLSPSLQRPVALALVENGRQRLGEVLQVHDDGRRVSVRIVEPAAYDPKGERINA